MTNDINGLYKLSEKTVMRLVSRSLTDKNGRHMPGASRYEIAAVIYLTHISDSNGYVTSIKATEIGDALSCSRRNAFILIKNLEKKGFIRILSKEHTGYMDLQLLENEYADVKDYSGKGTRYLNTNRYFFNQADPSYAVFMNLSLYAMRLLLYLLFNYNKAYGYHASYDALCHRLGIRSRSLVHKYLKELEPLLSSYLDFNAESASGCFYKSMPDEKKGLHYGRINIFRDNGMMLPDTGIGKDQDSYYKRYWISRIKEAGYLVSGLHATLADYADQLYQMASHYLKKNLKRALIESLIMEQIEADGILNELTMYHISDRLSGFVPS
jgi:hypothetical protein